MLSDSYLTSYLTSPGATSARSGARPTCAWIARFPRLLLSIVTMRMRTTFFPRPQSPVDPALLHLRDASLAGPTIEATREDRATLSLDQLPAELARILGDGVHELHIRWASPQPFETVSPLFARLAPGLHVFYTPQDVAGQTR